MKCAQALAALEAATHDRFGQIFAVFCLSTASTSIEEAGKKFEIAFVTLLKAHTFAQIMIERAFPPDKIDSGP